MVRGSAMRKVTVYLEPKRLMRDKKGRIWIGQNPKAAKANSFKMIKHVRVQKNLPKRLRVPDERHEYIEWQLMNRGMSYKSAHKIALVKEKHPIRGVRFVERKVKGR
jgi:hypothetical protein